MVARWTWSGGTHLSVSLSCTMYASSTRARARAAAKTHALCKSRVCLCTSCSLAMPLNASVALRKGSEVVAAFAGDGPTSNLSACVARPQKPGAAALAHA